MTHLTEGLQATASMIQSLLGEIRDNSVALAAFNAELKNLRDTVNLLSKIVKDGNGSDSLLTRLSLAEKAIRDLEISSGKHHESDAKAFKDISDKIEEALRDSEHKANALDKKIDDSISAERKDRREGTGQKLQFWATIVAAVLALGGTIATILLN